MQRMHALQHTLFENKIITFYGFDVHLNLCMNEKNMHACACWQNYKKNCERGGEGEGKDGNMRTVLA